MDTTAKFTVDSPASKYGQLTDHHYSNYLPGRKSNLRLNDQLIPKPTDINMGEKIIKVATPKEHPYASHIPRFAMFPPYISSDDAVKVEAEIPTSPPDVTLLSKTKGGPYRHEILKPLTAPKKSVRWSGDGERGFLEYPKPFKGESQVFYPTPTKIMRSRTKAHWDLPLFEEKNNMLRKVEHSHWLTSYQLHYSGSANLNIYDFKNGRNTHTAPTLKFESSQLNNPCRRTKGPGVIGPMTHVPVTASASPRPHESPAHYNKTLRLNQRGHGQSAEAQSADLSHKGSTGSSKCESRESSTQPFKRQDISMAQGNYEGNHNMERNEEDGGKGANGEEIDFVDKDKSMAPLQCHTSNLNVLPRPSVLPSIRPGTEEVSLRKVQDSFSKTQAHHKFNRSITQPSVNLRDNVCTGRKHDFYGVNSFYLHG